MQTHHHTVTLYLCSGDTIVHRLHGSEVTRDYFERTAFCSPVLVEQQEGLGFVVPPNITVSDIERCIGKFAGLFDIVQIAALLMHM